MIPTIGLMIWAYGIARLIEILCRDGARKPAGFAVFVMVVMMVVMCYSCANLMLSSFTIPKLGETSAPDIPGAQSEKPKPSVASDILRRSPLEIVTFRCDPSGEKYVEGKLKWNYKLVVRNNSESSKTFDATIFWRDEDGFTIKSSLLIGASVQALSRDTFSGNNMLTRSENYRFASSTIEIDSTY